MNLPHFFDRHPASPLPLTTCTLADLPLFAALGSQMEYLSFSGPEAAKFLQGQVTCDINEVVRGYLRLGAHCNPKGRAQATFQAYARQENTSEASQHITLLLPPGMAEPTQSQLKKFAAFSKVTLNVDHDTIAILMGGQQATDFLSAQGLIQQDAGLLQDGLPGIRLARLEAPFPLYILFTDLDTLDQLLSTPSAAAQPLHFSDQNGWWQILTALGQSHVFPSTQEQFIPQELNYDLIGGISFKKGCYKGQEIVARLHYKGTAKFRAARFTLTSENLPPIGETLVDSEGKRVGEIAQTASVSPQEHQLLAIVKTENPDATGYFLANGEPLPLKALSLPYAIP